VPLCSACGASALTCCKGDNAQRAGVGHSDYLGYVQGYGQILTDICYSGTGHCPSCRCARVPAGTTAPSSNDDDDEDKEDEDNDEEGGQKDKCD
jgi:hypothetical protein